MVQYSCFVASDLLPGTLYIVSTPIGNLEDISYRGVRVLSEVNLIAAEDTRHTAKLLRHYGITTRRISLHEHNETKKIPTLLRRLTRGETVALVSDAGTPVISDPGGRFARAALNDGLRVESIPGPTAVISALVSSGLATESFTFVGFPPYRSQARKSFFSSVVHYRRPVVFFEAPHRLRNSLTDLQEQIGERTVAVCGEMTKIHQSSVIGPISHVLDVLTTPRGEFTVVISAASRKFGLSELPSDHDLDLEFGHLTSNGRTRREAIRELAGRYGKTSRYIYQRLEVAKG